MFSSGESADFAATATDPAAAVAEGLRRLSAAQQQRDPGSVSDARCRIRQYSDSLITGSPGWTRRQCAA
jgi:hypothetical protein